MQTPQSALSAGLPLFYKCLQNTILRRQESKSKTKVFSQKSDMHAIVGIVNFQMMPPPFKPLWDYNVFPCWESNLNDFNKKSYHNLYI